MGGLWIINKNQTIYFQYETIKKLQCVFILYIYNDYQATGSTTFKNSNLATRFEPRQQNIAHTIP